MQYSFCTTARRLDGAVQKPPPWLSGIPPTEKPPAARPKTQRPGNRFQTVPWFVPTKASDRETKARYAEAGV